ncbi:hypothetical protein [Streptomyces hydrogenans]
MSASTQHTVTVVVPAQAATPAPQATPDPASTAASGEVQGASVHWAVTAALGMALTGLVPHQIPGLLPVMDAVGSFFAAVGRATPWQDPHDIDLINTSLLLHRPLLVTGRPGIGKSTLAYPVARELGLGRVLRWGIASRSTLRSGLYEYDAIGRARASLGYPRPGALAPGPDVGPAFGSPGEPNGETSGAGGAPRIGDFVRLGPLGTALLPYELPRVLLIDELDKSDIDLPNDLLHVLESGSYAIPELVSARHQEGPGPGVHRRPGRHGPSARRAGALPCLPFRRDHQQRRATVPRRLPPPLRPAGRLAAARGPAHRHDRRPLPGPGRPPHGHAPGVPGAQPEERRTRHRPAPERRTCGRPASGTTTRPGTNCSTRSGGSCRRAPGPALAPDRKAPARDASRPRLLLYRGTTPVPPIPAREDPTMPSRQTVRIIAVVLVVLLAVVIGLGAGIVTAALGASALVAVGAGGGAFIAIATLGMIIVVYLVPPAQVPAPAAPLPPPPSQATAASS